MRRLRPNSRHDVPLDNLACAFKDGIYTVVQGHVIKVLAAKAYIYMKCGSGLMIRPIIRGLALLHVDTCAYMFK